MEDGTKNGKEGHNKNTTRHKYRRKKFYIENMSVSYRSSERPRVDVGVGWLREVMLRMGSRGKGETSLCRRGMKGVNI